MIICFSTQGKADFINLDQFVNFLNEKQRDPRLNEILYPLYDEKRAAEIIVTYEQDEAARNENRLTKDGFIRYVQRLSILTSFFLITVNFELFKLEVFLYN